MVLPMISENGETWRMFTLSVQVLLLKIVAALSAQ